MWWSWRTPSTREMYVLWCLSCGQVGRHGLCGDLEPYLIDGHSVSGALTLLALRGLVNFDVTGTVRLTSRGKALTLIPPDTRLSRMSADLPRSPRRAAAPATRLENLDSARRPGGQR